jgi:hypothetical protein
MTAMSIQRQSCPFHTDDDVLGVLTPDGAYSFTCERTTGHPTSGGYSWLHDPVVQDVAGLGGLAEELGLAQELPAALTSLGRGWFEYGLVERAYATTRPADFRVMVERWGHTSKAPKQYTASAYIAGVLGRLTKDGVVYYHPGPGTGRWSYNGQISYWSTDPDSEWDERTPCVSIIGDHAHVEQKADVVCRDYALGEPSDRT